MFTRPMARSSSILAAVVCTLVLSACSSDSTAPQSSFRARGGYAIVDPPTDPGTTPPPPTTVPPVTTPQPQLIPVFVIGDGQSLAVGSAVNFWGAHWSKNNRLTGVSSNGVASFKGYITQSDLECGGTWTSSHGWHPPAVIAKTIAVIVTSTVLKTGPDFAGDIKKIVTVTQDGSYGPNPGHEGFGVVTGVVCSR